MITLTGCVHGKGPVSSLSGQRRDPGHARPWFAVVDGNNTQIDAITACAAWYQVRVPILIDFIHVVQYLWKAAATFFYPGDPQARDWVKAQAAKILHGSARDVRAGSRVSLDVSLRSPRGRSRRQASSRLARAGTAVRLYRCAVSVPAGSAGT